MVLVVSVAVVPIVVWGRRVVLAVTAPRLRLVMLLRLLRPAPRCLLVLRCLALLVLLLPAVVVGLGMILRPPRALRVKLRPDIRLPESLLLRLLVELWLTIPLLACYFKCRPWAAVKACLGWQAACVQTPMIVSIAVKIAIVVTIKVELGAGNKNGWRRAHGIAKWRRR